MKKVLDELQSQGIYTFSREYIKDKLNISEIALKKALQRYERKGRILRIRRKFYIIIPLEYKSAGILPPFWFINDLMKYLNVQYYVGLVSAAGINGASHQQPQKLQVIVNKQLSSIKIKQLQIDFITKK
ncbi:type IV toxin-antitoxin system AbiEi family antitoxin domain-containing protein, partial [bacterium]|nr:type IV toxin-antitoxin system AbiEi family antitoxin domain-containing protein [bacterium]